MAPAEIDAVALLNSNPPAAPSPVAISTLGGSELHHLAPAGCTNAFVNGDAGVFSD